MAKLFGLRIIRHGQPDVTEWVSVFSSQIAKRIALIQKDHPTALFEQLESELVIPEEGVYLCEDKTTVRITHMNDVKASGYPVTIKDGVATLRKFSFGWYLNGQSVLEGYPAIKEFISL